MRKTDFTKALTEYFSIYLPTTCGVSPNTTNSYRDTFKQLLLFFQEKKGISANYIELRYLNMELVSEFLDWLETSRHIAVTTRNQLCNRLAAAVFEVKMMVWVKCSILWAFPWGAPAKLAVETKPLKYFLGCG